MKGKLTLLYSLMFLMCGVWLCIISCSHPLPDKAEWMAGIDDVQPMAGLALPGTHDSGARFGGEGLQTQTYDIPAQLAAGIRAFDVRLRMRDGKLGLYHSEAFQQVYWEDDVLPAFLRFLQEHPTEALVVSLKREGGSREFYEQLLSASLSLPAHRDCFVPSFREGLTLGECRGKILFLHRDDVMPLYPGARCEGWADNATCTLGLRNAQGERTDVWLQDEYQYASAEVAAKQQAVMRLLEKLADEPDGSLQWGISFVSATGLPEGTPLAFARQLNGSIAELLAWRRLKPRGIVFLDFVEQEDGRRLVDYLIRCNIY